MKKHLTLVTALTLSILVLTGCQTNTMTASNFSHLAKQYTAPFDVSGFDLRELKQAAYRSLIEDQSPAILTAVQGLFLSDPLHGRKLNALLKSLPNQIPTRVTAKYILTL